MNLYVKIYKDIISAYHLNLHPHVHFGDDQNNQTIGHLYKKKLLSKSVHIWSMGALNQQTSDLTGSVTRNLGHGSVESHSVIYLSAGLEGNIYDVIIVFISHCFSWSNGGHIECAASRGRGLWRCTGHRREHLWCKFCSYDVW